VSRLRGAPKLTAFGAFRAQDLWAQGDRKCVSVSRWGNGRRKGYSTAVSGISLARGGRMVKPRAGRPKRGRGWREFGLRAGPDGPCPGDLEGEIHPREKTFPENFGGRRISKTAEHSFF